MMSISIHYFKREMEIMKKLENAPDNPWDKVYSISGILTDIKQSTGKRTMAYLLKDLYQDNMGEMKADIAKMVLLEKTHNPPQADRFKVLSAIWPAVSALCTIDEEFFTLAENIGQNAQGFYENPNI